jgi:predicted DNA-binding protein with PD1-like motif
MKQYLFRINEGEKLIDTLQKKVDESGIVNGLIVSLVGALRDFSLVTIKQDSTSIPPAHYETFYDRKAELTGNGIISEGKVHIHAVCGQDGGVALSGHLVEATVTYFVDVGIISE